MLPGVAATLEALRVERDAKGGLCKFFHVAHQEPKSIPVKAREGF